MSPPDPHPVVPVGHRSVPRPAPGPARRSRHGGLGVLPLWAGLAVVALVGAGCEDALGPEGDELGLAGLPVGLPTPVTIAQLLGEGETPDEATVPTGELVSAWRASWALDVVEGERSRERVRSELAVRAHALGPGVLGVERERLHAVLAEIRELVGDSARSFPDLASIEGALTQGPQDGVVAWEELLAATDGLLRLDPGVLAADLLACAGRADRRNPEGAPYSGIWIDRAEHLRSGARLAVLDDDRLLAVRRAFYGCRLLAEHVDGGPAAR